MSSTYPSEIKVDLDKKAPVPATARNMLRRDAQNIRATADRKQITLDRHEEVEESRVANESFELGCWLHHYSGKVGLDSDIGFKSRVECALRLFLGGVINPGYRFFTVFDFGERQFDAIFEMGDAAEVIERLRKAQETDSTGRIEKAFQYFGWPISE